MDNWLNYFIQVNLYLIIVGLSYEFGFRKSKNYHFSRPFLLLGSILAFLIPMIKLPVVAIATNPIVIYPVVFNAITVTPDKLAPNFNYLNILWFILFSGFIIQLVRFAYGLVKLQLLKKASVKKATYYEVANSMCAFSFLNSIFIGSEIPEHKKEIILKHEQIHLNRMHCIDLLYAQFLQCVLWYNPISYQLTNYLKEVHEFEADQAALDNKEAYIELLLQQNFQNFNFSPIHQFNSNHLKNRIMRINNKTSQISKTAIVITIATFGLLFLNYQSASSKDNLIGSAVETNNNLDELPKFSDNDLDFPKFVQRNFTFVDDFIDRGLVGEVLVEFSVEKDGSLKDIRIVDMPHTKAADPSELNLLRTEVIKLMEKSPKWIPARKNGKVISSKIQIPIFLAPFPSNEKENLQEGEPMPEYPGGNQALLQFISKSIVYPKSLEKEKVVGTVYTELTINTNGEIESIKYLKDSHPTFQQEIERVLKLLEKFKPAMKNGKAVKSKIILPIKFMLK